MKMIIKDALKTQAQINMYQNRYYFLRSYTYQKGNSNCENENRLHVYLALGGISSLNYDAVLLNGGRSWPDLI